jgi:hypothetical protein
MGLAIPTLMIDGFETYLKAQKKRNVKQILCYAQRYHDVLETGDASPLVNLPSGPIKRHAMEALTAYAKYSGLYEQWCQIRKSYSLHWTNVLLLLLFFFLLVSIFTLTVIIYS